MPQDQNRSKGASEGSGHTEDRTESLIRALVRPEGYMVSQSSLVSVPTNLKGTLSAPEYPFLIGTLFVLLDVYFIPSLS